MTNLVVISFKNEAQAVAGSHRLTELGSHGAITVYEKVIVKKDLNGETNVKQGDTSDGLRVLSGMALGTLIGALAGPVGLLVGMISGTMTGALLETNHYHFSDDFISKVYSHLQPGAVAIVAEIYEQGPAFVDNAMEALGGTIIRSNVDDAYDEFLDDQVKGIEADIAAERARIKSAHEKEKSKIQQRIAHLKEKRRQRIAELKEKQKARKEARFKEKISEQKAETAELERELKKMER
jgi:uncharacterized membrane protein